jgi:hypothetical protein
MFRGRTQRVGLKFQLFNPGAPAPTARARLNRRLQRRVNGFKVSHDLTDYLRSVEPAFNELELGREGEKRPVISLDMACGKD